LLGYFVVTEKMELINFAHQKIDGVRYLRPAHAPLLDASETSISTANRALRRLVAAKAA